MRAGDEARALAAATAFLTRLPVGRLVVLHGDDVSRGGAYFPVVGAAIGAAVGGIAEGLVHVLPALVAAGIAVAAGALLTGALHLDALADTADALTAGRERALAIMRDHAVGAYGTVALVLDLLVKSAALAALAADRSALWPAIAAGALSRWTPVALGAALRAIRTEGAGAAFRVTRLTAGAAAVLAAGIAVVAGRLHGVEVIAAAAATALLLGLYFRHWLGGATGDVLGAAAELTETVVLVTAVALLVP